MDRLVTQNLSGRRFAYLSTILDDYETLKLYKWGVESGYSKNGMAEGEFAVPVYMGNCK